MRKTGLVLVKYLLTKLPELGGTFFLLNIYFIFIFFSQQWKSSTLSKAIQIGFSDIIFTN
jgi:hypothetical protein